MTQPLAGGPERAVNCKDIMPATAPFVVDSAGQQSPSLKPDVTDSESESDDELYVLTPQNLAPVAVVVPAVPPVVQRPPAWLAMSGREEHYSTVTRPQSYLVQYRNCFEISCFVDMTCM